MEPPLAAPGEFQAKNFQEDELVTKKLKGGTTMKAPPNSQIVKRGPSNGTLPGLNQVSGLVKYSV